MNTSENEKQQVLTSLLEEKSAAAQRRGWQFQYNWLPGKFGVEVKANHPDHQEQTFSTKDYHVNGAAAFERWAEGNIDKLL